MSGRPFPKDTIPEDFERKPIRNTTACSEVCSKEPKEPGYEIKCTFQVWVDDMGFTKTKTNLNECLIKKEICEEGKKDIGQPDSFEKVSCESILPKKAEYKKTVNDFCKVPTPKSPDCVGATVMTAYVYYDGESCRPWMSGNSCDGGGPFKTIEECEKAVAAKKCDP